MGDHKSDSNAPLAAMPDAMALPAMRGGMVPCEKASTPGGGAGMVVGVAPDKRQLADELEGNMNHARREKALAMVSSHVAMSGVCCMDHASVRTWCNLTMCTKGAAGCVPSARAEEVLSRNGWWLRGWWTRVSVWQNCVERRMAS